MLPLGATAEQSESALKSLVKALDGQVPSGGSQGLKLARDAFMWKEYRSSTKQLLCAVANSLRQFMPENWNLSSLKPPNLLAPRSVTGERFMYLKEECDVRADLSDLQVAFVYDFKSGMRFPDYYLDESSFYRLVFAADEGTEVREAKRNQFPA